MTSQNFWYEHQELSFGLEMFALLNRTLIRQNSEISHFSCTWRKPYQNENFLTITMAGKAWVLSANSKNLQVKSNGNEDKMFVAL